MHAARISWWLVMVIAGICLTPVLPARGAEPAPLTTISPADLTLVVMDPLALPLSCPCVKGYAQRNYEKLASYLEAKLGRPVKVTFSESLKTALDRNTKGRADVVIGKQSVVQFDARESRREFTPVASLTGKDGRTMMTGLIVVPAADPAQRVEDLKDYRIIFGPQECDEKHAAAIALLKDHRVAVPEKLETSASCSEGAVAILEAGPTVRGAAVISSYARPLLEGCGTVEKGALRVVGETKPVPFVTAFVSDKLSAADRAAITEALLAMSKDTLLCLEMESTQGFLPYLAQKPDDSKKK